MLAVVPEAPVAARGGRPTQQAARVRGAQVLSALQHDRIVCLLGACLVPPHVCLVEELAPTSLFARLHPSLGACSPPPPPFPIPPSHCPVRPFPSALVSAPIIACACVIFRFPLQPRRPANRLLRMLVILLPLPTSTPAPCCCLTRRPFPRHPLQPETLLQMPPSLRSLRSLRLRCHHKVAMPLEVHGRTPRTIIQPDRVLHVLLSHVVAAAAAGGDSVGQARRVPTMTGPPSSESPLTHGGAVGGTSLSPILVDALPDSPLTYTEVGDRPACTPPSPTHPSAPGNLAAPTSCYRSTEVPPGTPHESWEQPLLTRLGSSRLGLQLGGGDVANTGYRPGCQNC